MKRSVVAIGGALAGAMLVLLVHAAAQVTSAVAIAPVVALTLGPAVAAGLLVAVCVAVAPPAPPVAPLPIESRKDVVR